MVILTAVVKQMIDYFMEILFKVVKTLKMNSKETLDGPFLEKYGSKTIFLSKTVRRC